MTLENDTAMATMNEGERAILKMYGYDNGRVPDVLNGRVCDICGSPYSQDGCPYLIRRDVDPPSACLLWLYRAKRDVEVGPA